MDMFEPFEEQIELETFELEFEDGTKQEVAIIARFEVEFEETDATQEYIAVAEMNNGELNGDNMEVMIFRYYQDPMDKEKFQLGDISDPEEQAVVSEVFDDIMNSDDDEEENDVVYTS